MTGYGSLDGVFHFVPFPQSTVRLHHQHRHVRSDVPHTPLRELDCSLELSPRTLVAPPMS
jgi:hypothetical protein